MVEEAGEILEAHVLTSLTSKTKHLIMIGDHKQLRPKVEHYDLCIQAGKGYSLNVSLFERLVCGGSPHATLAVQHRMHPDISTLIKHTYPTLQDHPSVLSHPAVRGLASAQRLVFIDHTKPELQEAGSRKRSWQKQYEYQSKVNMHEVEMVVAVVRYLLQQEYRPDQLVVLTPYLGQLVELQRALGKEVEVMMNQMDLRDLRAAATQQVWSGVRKAVAVSENGGSGSSSGSGTDDDGDSNAAGSAASSSKATNSPAAPVASEGQSASNGTRSNTNGSNSRRRGAVYVATIDNYQGEEADIVVASLVRSNSQGKVGFLKEPERINVLLSRARHGMILIGNSSTLRSASSAEARKHWGVVLDNLEHSGAVLPGLPAVCQQHQRAVLPLLDSPGAFSERAPDGGCTAPCEAVLPCGHMCRLRCHAYDREHARVKCGEIVYGYCSKGHLTSRRCFEEAAVCSTCVQIRQLLMKERAEQERLVSNRM